MADAVPSAVRAAIKLAEMAQKEGKTSEARGYLDQAQSLGVPENLSAPFLYRQALVLKSAGETSAAQEVLTRIIQQQPSSEFALAALLALGEIAFEEKPAEALTIYADLAARANGGPYSKVARLRSAQTHLKLGQWDEAARVSESLAADKVDTATREEAIYVRARVHQQKAEFDQARELYRQVIGPDRTETAAKAQFMLAETLFLQEHWSEAIREFLKVNILYPIPEWQSLALVEMGKCHVRLAQVAEAKKAFEEVIEKFGGLPAAPQARQQLELLSAPKPSGK
jgi:cellulose synthase operon protein C